LDLLLLELEFLLMVFLALQEQQGLQVQLVLKDLKDLLVLQG
jgi:hypothetical protein